MDSAQFREAGHRAIDDIVDYYDTVQRGPVRPNVEPGFLRKVIPDTAPIKGESWEKIDEDMKKHIQPGLAHWMHPGFMAYFPASSTFEGILGELFCAAFNGPAFDWAASPSVTELETIVMDWLVDLLSLPNLFKSSANAGGGGIIMGSTTECLISTMNAARSRILSSTELTELGSSPNAEGLQSVRDRLVVLSGSETHMATAKAAHIIGVKHRSIRCCPAGGIGLTGSLFAKLVDECRADGLIPFFVTATLGTTNTCAIDDFGGIAKVVRLNPEIWIHVDAAYAGAALACEEYAHLAQAIGDCDSLSVNLGKWLLTNLDCTALVVKQQQSLTDSLQNTCDIVASEETCKIGVVDYRNWQLSMGRRFRALKVWFVMRSWGKDGIRNHIRQHTLWANNFTAMLRSRSDLFTIVTRPQFALNVFRVSDCWASRVRMTPDQATSIALDYVNSTNRFWLSKTKVNDRMVIRVVSANVLANMESLEQVFALLVEGAQSLERDMPHI